MSPLWSDMALARAAWAKAEETNSADEGKVTPRATERSLAASRPVRRVLHSRLGSFAL
ncbi:MAG: hypothetical protein ACJ8FS_07800 [Sphingomicrobium sp.]